MAWRWNSVSIVLVLGALFGLSTYVDAASSPQAYSVGISKTEISPPSGNGLEGLGPRRTGADGKPIAVWAKAIAISADGKSEPIVLVTVDNFGVSAALRAEVVNRLRKTSSLKGDHLAITSSHTHTGIPLKGLATSLLGRPMTANESRQVDQYTSFVIDRLEQLVLEAIKNQRPSRLSWGIGSVGFAANRQKGGPVDHDLPLLAVKDLDGKLRAVYVSYACHGESVSNNRTGGDWAGIAQELIQAAYPSAETLISIGCSSDQQPLQTSTAKPDAASRHGAEIAAEVTRMLGGFLIPVQGEIGVSWLNLSLELAEAPTKAVLEQRAKESGPVGFHAKLLLEQLSQGQSLASRIEYPVSTWTFGDRLAMVFFPGEVSADLALRLKKELDGRRLWINTYSNDVACGVPSDRILNRKGYDPTEDLVEFNQPSPLKPGAEGKIVHALHQLLDSQFAPPFDPTKTNGTLPRSPQQAADIMQTTPNLRVDLVVSEPLVADPVAIDFGLNGELWVAEMGDYPIGPAKFDATPNGELAPGGQVRLVRDLDGDGQFDSSTVFLDKIPMPTGITAWRKGVLICSAPDIIYAEDTNGDDRADVVKKLFSGFRATNIQARVNSLVYGLDGWIHGSCGGVGGTITNFKGEKFDIGFRDFRIHPDTGEMEPAAGRTQQGRDRDDFGNWFGCDNLNLAFHYPLPEHYLKRNPHIVPPPNRVNIAATEDAQRLFPSRADAQRFQLSGAPGTVTAACGLGVYRDSRLGAEYTGNLFVCEPVNLLVHRLVLKPNGTSFVAERAANEVQSEFLRSPDSWCRPVQAITGPDGAIWVVDMYRFIIENPRWIPENELQGLDVRAGTSLGRIYRVRNANDTLPPATKFVTAKDASPQHRTVGDTHVYQELKMDQIVAGSEGPQKANEATILASDASSRISRYRFKEARHQLVDSDIEEALNDRDAHIRAFGLTLAEKYLPKNRLPKGLIEAAGDDNDHLRIQAAFSLGEWDDEQVPALLAGLAIRDASDPYLVAAVFSSVTRKNLTPFTASLFKKLDGREPPSSLMPPFLATAVGLSDDAAIKIALEVVAGKPGEQPKTWQLSAVTILLESLAKRKDKQVSDASVQNVIKQMQTRAQEIVVAESVPEDLRLAAITLVGREPDQKLDDANRLVQLLSSLQTPTVQVAAVEALERIGVDEVPAMLSEHFRELSPSIHPAVVDVFLGRDVWIPKLFDGIEQGTIPVTAMAANQRQEVLGHRVASVRERSSKVLSSLINSNRREVIQQYQAALDHPGDAAKGRALFMKTCSQCHRLGDIGYSVGPNLGMVATKPPAYLLQEMLDPNRNVEARYTSYIASTKDGLSRTGILTGETATNLTLLGPEAKEFVIPRAEIEEIRASGKSLMPEGLEKDIPVESAADLIAFLCSVPSASKKFEGNTPEVITSEGGRVDLTAAKAAIIGDRIQFAVSSGSIVEWNGIQDRVSWTLELTEPAEYQVLMDYSCDNDSAGNGYVLETGSTNLSGHVKSTGQASKYEAIDLGSITLTAGSHRIVLRPDGGAMKGSLANLRAVHLVPAGEAVALANLSVPTVTSDVAVIAKELLDDNIPDNQRQQVIHDHPTKAAEIVTAMTADMPDDTKEEYRRIPWIWRVAVACGKRNQVDQNRALMDVSLPKLDQPLTDWKAVVIGGGVINGIGLVGGWPRTRLDEILGDDADLKKRWQRTLDLAAKMADDEKINTGTRYDALRIVALDDRPAALEQLKKYLPKGTHDELQMGAISGLSDVDSKEVPKLLLENLAHFNDENRALALSALVRKDQRAEILLDAISSGSVKSELLSEPQKKALLESKNNAIRERATKLLGKS